jgi:pantoate--beta-alanine ligase
MKVSRTIADLRAALAPFRADARVGFVPTMGALHAGHVALFAAAREECDVVVASIFVNPAQFGPYEDLARYPRDPGQDKRRAQEAGVDHLFVPSVDEIYPDGFQTWVEVEEIAKGLEGAARPGHFRGVATVCLKLFNIVQPSRVYFGQKDAQQAAVIERMIRDLAVPVELRVVPTVRDRDGLALSSRNVYLSEGEREAARALPSALLAGERAHREGGDALAAARAAIAQEPRLNPEYVELARFDGRLLLVAAARVGGTRLIDNVVLEGER